MKLLEDATGAAGLVASTLWLRFRVFRIKLMLAVALLPANATAVPHLRLLPPGMIISAWSFALYKTSQP